jgi:class 3 adenylate cyclase
VSALSLLDVAHRAGVDPTYVERLVDLGVVHRDVEGLFADHDDRRVAVIKAVDDAGLPVDGIAEALRRGQFTLDFVDWPAYDRFGSVGPEPFSAVSERTALPLSLVLSIREAMGSAHPAPEDHMRDGELEVVPLLALLMANGSSVATMDRTLRSFGLGLRRIAETEADWWRSDVQGPLQAAGRTLGDIGQGTGDLTLEFERVSDRAVLALYHGQQANAWMRNILEGFEVALGREGLYERRERPPAICFVDLTGYTRLTEERGDAAAADLAGRIARMVDRTAAECGGKAIKWLGDGVMLHFGEPGQGVAAALDIVGATAALGLPPAHVGLDAGPVLFQEGDYYGRTVNVAARIGEFARPGEVLVSQAVVDALADDEHRFDAIGPIMLKGLTDAVDLYVARRAIESAIGGVTARDQTHPVKE